MLTMDHIVIDETVVNSDLITNRGQKYPNIFISKDTIVKPSIATAQQTGDIFLENDTNFWKRAFHHYRYKGFYPLLSFTKQYCEEETLSTDLEKLPDLSVKCFYWFASFLLFLRTMYLTIYFYFYPFDKLSDAELVKEFNVNLDWNNGLIRAFEWHPTSLRCAMALVNDLIYIYSADLQRPLNHICCLKNLAQKRIASMAWHPKQDNILAVASENRVLIWSLQSDIQHFKPDADKCLQIIDSKLSSPVTSIVFDAEGKTLVACSPRSSSLSIITFNWSSLEPVKNCSIRLLRNPLSSQLTSLKWSPDKHRLLAHTTSQKIRVFENLQWSSKCWHSNLTSICQTSCWSRPSGRILLYAAKNSSQIYALTFYDKAEAGDVGGSRDKSYLLLDTTEPHFPEQQLGSHISGIAWDDNSSRLAILFKDKPEVIALFGTQLSSSLMTWPLCTISSDFGTNPSVPLLAKFHDYYKEGGCLLSICWSNGIVSHVTLPVDNSSSQVSDIISSPRSLTTLCTSVSRTQYDSPSAAVQSPETSLANVTANSSVIKRVNANLSKLGSPFSPVTTPRRPALFTTRFIAD